MKKANIVLTKEELEVLVWIVDDWRTMKSDGKIGVVYPNRSITSTKLVTFLYDILKRMK